MELIFVCLVMLLDLKFAFCMSIKYENFLRLELPTWNFVSRNVLQPTTRFSCMSFVSRNRHSFFAIFLLDLSETLFNLSLMNLFCLPLNSHVSLFFVCFKSGTFQSSCSFEQLVPVFAASPRLLLQTKRVAVQTIIFLLQRSRIHESDIPNGWLQYKN